MPKKEDSQMRRSVEEKKKSPFGRKKLNRSKTKKKRRKTNFGGLGDVSALKLGVNLKGDSKK